MFLCFVVQFNIYLLGKEWLVVFKDIQLGSFGLFEITWKVTTDLKDRMKGIKLVTKSYNRPLAIGGIKLSSDLEKQYFLESMEKIFYFKFHAVSSHFI